MKIPFELIEKYLDGDLDQETKKKVERLISEDKEFEKEYLFRLELNQAIQEKDVMTLRENLSQIYKAMHTVNSGNVIKLFSKNWHLVAASISILIVVGSFLLTNLNHPSADDLFDTYYNSESAISATRSGNSNFQENLKVALQKYDQNEFDAAITLLEDINDNLVADFYLGMAYVEIESYDKASESFTRILDEESNLFEEQAEWYNALCILKLGKKDEAKDIFSEITEGNSLYKKDAVKILKALN